MKLFVQYFGFPAKLRLFSNRAYWGKVIGGLFRIRKGGINL